MKSSAVASIVSASPVAGVPVDELLPDLHGESRVRGDPSSDRERLVEELLVRHDGLDEPDLERLLGVDDVGGEREPARPVAADDLGAAHEPVAGLEADDGLAEPEGGAVGGDHDVAGQDDLGAASVTRRR